MKQFPLIVWAAALLIAAPSVASASGPVQAADVSLPSVTGPLPSTPESYPFNAAAETRVPQSLEKHGYVEEEYLLRGKGRIYDHPALGELRPIGGGDYTTRVLIRRPKERARFNGAVIVEPFNPSRMADVDLMWIFSREHLMREGYIWIGVTFKPVAGEALKRFDPVRYKSISFANPLPAAGRCPDVEIGPDATDTEVGFSFDILSQLGALVRADVAENPLRWFGVKRVYMTGYSQTAGLARSYAVAISPTATRDRGKRIYDGYLYVGHAPYNVLFHNCDALYEPADPRLTVPPVGVPVIDIAVEGDVLVTAFQRRPDSDAAPDLFRRYEVAGATHSGNLVGPFTPREEDFERAGAFSTAATGCLPAEPALSDFPLDHVFNAAWQNLERWVVEGAPPPRGELLRLTKDPASLKAADFNTAEKDALGNATGGVRTVALEAPTRRWHGARDGLSRCLRVGYSEPLDPATLRELYPTHADYLRRVTEAAARLQAERWLTPNDAEAAVNAAWHSPTP
jgi:hypothetical protein